MAGVALLAVTTSAQADVGAPGWPAGAAAPVGEPAALLAPVTLPPATRSLPASHVATPPLARAAGGAGTIPALTLAAYQRAATVIDQADPTCHLGWAVLAGLGRVETDHGRVGGSTLDAAGTAVPGIFGPRLDGSHGRPRVPDTDRGSVDGDPRFDRAVGPLQLLPATWRDVAVDADGDGRRDPQDINDAALGAAVHLCAGSGDLAGRSAQRVALLRLVRDPATVTRVLSVATSYAATTELAAVTAPAVAAPAPARPVAAPVLAAHHDPHHPAADGAHAPAAGAAGHTSAHPHSAHPTTPPAAPLPTCEAQVLPPAVARLLHGILGGTLTQVVAALRAVPLVGSRLVAELTTCVRSHAS